MVAFSDLVWDEQSTPEQWRTGFAEAHKAWTQFSTAEALRVAMYDWEKVGMDWFAAALREGHGRLDEFDERFKQAAEAKRAPDRAFQQAAQDALGTQHP
ncbi:hypothetical protein [Streptomyces diastatochromogenes]|uniref:Uncharacterized protein n=1 Tax=Streptomyces diastatochromogenes TaxID=42236 RepID=A0A233RT38_STRDA|nr:hypothetical protein [Streptomyces diastatochromogenes]OXY86547.1 hypothetical protein BEK98_44600 [Streptomyces diastatochromogenes]